jgi:hypothetical protein
MYRGLLRDALRVVVVVPLAVAAYYGSLALGDAAKIAMRPKAEPLPEVTIQLPSSETSQQKAGCLPHDTPKSNPWAQSWDDALKATEEWIAWGEGCGIDEAQLHERLAQLEKQKQAEKELRAQIKALQSH